MSLSIFVISVALIVAFASGVSVGYFISDGFAGDGCDDFYCGRSPDCSDASLSCYPLLVSRWNKSSGRWRSAVKFTPDGAIIPPYLFNS